MAEKLSFIAALGAATAKSVEKKQEEIEKELYVGGKKEGGEVKVLSSSDAIRVQVGAAELNVLSGAATAVINTEKTTMQAILRNV